MQLSTLLKNQDKISLHYSKELWSTEGIVSFDGEELVIEISNVMILHRFGRYMIQWSATQLNQWHMFESMINRELEQGYYQKLSKQMRRKVNVEMPSPFEQREKYIVTIQLSYRILFTNDKNSKITESNSIVQQKLIIHKFTKNIKVFNGMKRKRNLPSKLPSVDKLFEETSDCELTLKMAASNPLTNNTTLETYYDSFIQQIPLDELDKFQKCLWYQLWKQSLEKIKLPCDDSDDDSLTKNDTLKNNPLLRKRLRKKEDFLETLREEIHDPVGPRKNVRELECAEINRVIYPFEGSQEEYMFCMKVHVNIPGNWHEVDFECFVKLSMKDYCKLKLWYNCDDENPTTMTSIHPCVVDIDIEVNEHFVTQFLSLNVDDFEPDVGEVIESDVEIE